MFESILYIALVILGIGVLIFVHELGHFMVAKWAKVKVEAFALGFGPRLVKFTRGETEYRLCLIPLGGYVKMAGESFADEERTGADYEFTAKPPMTRIKIILAGALMNLIFAFPACALVYFIGINFVAPLVGQVRPGSAEWSSDIQPGDIITHFDGEKITSLDDYHRAIIRTTIGTEVKVRLRREGEVITTTVVARGSKGLGIIPRANIIAGFKKDSPAPKSGFKLNDEILEVNGKFIFSADDLNREIRRHPGEQLSIMVRHPDQTIETLSIVPEASKRPLYELRIADLTPALIGSVKKGAPADQAGILPGDKIIQVNDPQGGTSIHSWKGLVKIVKESGGKSLNIVILRDNQRLEIPNVIPQLDPAGNGSLGIVSAASNIIGEVPEDSSLAQAGLQPCDIIIQAQGKEIHSLFELEPLAWKSQGKSIEILVRRKEATFTTSLTPRAFPQGNIGVLLKTRQVRQKYPLFQSISAGASEAIDLLGLTFQLIWKLINREESPKGLAGPVGIFRVSFLMVQEGVSKFLWLLALFSLNLAILNLLPIPVLDGGLIMFTLIEKIKGSPVNTKVLIVAQYIGLFLLLSLVLFVSYNDITRWLGGG